jgi:hypothetical protein
MCVSCPWGMRYCDVHNFLTFSKAWVPLYNIWGYLHLAWYVEMYIMHFNMTKTMSNMWWYYCVTEHCSFIWGRIQYAATSTCQCKCVNVCYIFHTFGKICDSYTIHFDQDIQNNENRCITYGGTYPLGYRKLLNCVEMYLVEKYTDG